MKCLHILFTSSIKLSAVSVLIRFIPCIYTTVIRNVDDWPQGSDGDALDRQWLQKRLSVLATVKMCVIRKNSSGFKAHLICDKI